MGSNFILCTLTDSKLFNPEAIFAQSESWIEYAPNSWIIMTSKSAYEIYSELETKIGASTHILCVEIEPLTLSGSLHRSVWEWFQYVKVA